MATAAEGGEECEAQRAGAGGVGGSARARIEAGGVEPRAGTGVALTCTGDALAGELDLQGHRELVGFEDQELVIDADLRGMEADADPRDLGGLEDRGDAGTFDREWGGEH